MKKSGSINVILLPASFPPGWLIRAISPSNLARRVSAFPLLPASCPALISFISKEGRDFSMTKFLLGFPEEIDGAAWLLGRHLILQGLAGLRD